MEGGHVARRGWLIAIVIIIIAISGATYWILHLDISAIHNPGKLETSIANSLRGWYISRGAQTVPVSTVANNAASVSDGENLYGMACASCHGQDGRKPAPIGNSMYPRVPTLSSPAVQQLSDKELFWVIKNGIRLSGMPGFAKISSDPEIWQIAYYVRSLGKPVKQSSKH